VLWTFALALVWVERAQGGVVAAVGGEQCRCGDQTRRDESRQCDARAAMPAMGRLERKSALALQPFCGGIQAAASMDRLGSPRGNP